MRVRALETKHREKQAIIAASFVRQLEYYLIVCGLGTTFLVEMRKLKD